MTFCEQALSYLAIAGGTYFWLWYLTREIERYKGNAKPRWYERDIVKRRKPNDTRSTTGTT